ncbi:MAG: hypothetical protein GX254_03570 [Clostridiales bacterium]|nr:hypothetical protein [Clostridiales bacterium]
MIISLATGFGTGILYDFLGVIRRRLKPAAFGYILDLLFCVAVGFAFFAIGYGPGGGRLRLFMLVFIVLGCLLYFFLLSRVIGGFLSKMTDFIIYMIHCLLMPFVWLYRFFGKTKKIIKNLFIYLSKWFIIYKRVSVPLDKWRKSAGGRKEARHETQKSKFIYKSGGSGSGGIHYGDFNQTAHVNKRSRSEYGGNREPNPGKKRVHFRPAIRN